MRKEIQIEIHWWSTSWTSSDWSLCKTVQNCAKLFKEEYKFHLIWLMIVQNIWVKYNIARKKVDQCNSGGIPVNHIAITAPHSMHCITFQSHCNGIESMPDPALLNQFQAITSNYSVQASLAFKIQLFKTKHIWQSLPQWSSEQSTFSGHHEPLSSAAEEVHIGCPSNWNGLSADVNSMSRCLF